MLLALRRKTRKKVQRKMWVRHIFARRRQQGEYHNLLQELRVVDPESHFRYLRMSKERFDTLLSMVSIKKSCPRVTAYTNFSWAHPSLIAGTLVTLGQKYHQQRDWHLPSVSLQQGTHKYFICIPAMYALTFCYRSQCHSVSGLVGQLFVPF